MLRRKLEKSAFYQRHKYRLEKANDIVSFVSALCLILFLFGDQSHLSKHYNTMNQEIKSMAVVTGIHTGIFQIDGHIIRAMTKVPRQHYINKRFGNYAYENVALPVEGADYAVPEPFVTAMMVHLLDIGPDDKILDVGRGASYDAAVMARLGREVHSVKHIEAIDSVSNTPDYNIHYTNIKRVTTDNPQKWGAHGPYDAILIRQALPAPPQYLLRQLKPGARLVMPQGTNAETKTLMLYERTNDGAISAHKTINMKIAPLLKGQQT